MEEKQVSAVKTKRGRENVKACQCGSVWVFSCLLMYETAALMHVCRHMHLCMTLCMCVLQKWWMWWAQWELFLEAGSPSC